MKANGGPIDRFHRRHGLLAGLDLANVDPLGGLQAAVGPKDWGDYSRQLRLGLGMEKLRMAQQGL
jgi:hypothetical protein